MSDLLSASSLFLAVLGLLHGAWYGEVSSAIAVEKHKYRADREPAIATLRSAYLTRSLPLTVAAIVVALILLPPFFAILSEAVGTWAHLGLNAITEYDAVKMLFAAVWIAMAAFALHTAMLAARLAKRLAEFRQSD